MDTTQQTFLHLYRTKTLHVQGATDMVPPVAANNKRPDRSLQNTTDAVPALGVLPTATEKTLPAIPAAPAVGNSDGDKTENQGPASRVRTHDPCALMPQ